MSGNIFAINLSPGGTTPFYYDDCPFPRAASAQATFNWQVPAVFDAGQPYTISPAELVNKGAIKGVQGLFMDNSACAFPVVITDASGMAQICPPYSQGTFPIKYAQNSEISFNVKGNTNIGFELYSTTIVTLLNYPVEAYVWATEPAATSEDSIFTATGANGYGTVNETVIDTFTGPLFTFGGGPSLLTGKIISQLNAPNGFVIEEVTGGYLSGFVGAAAAMGQLTLFSAAASNALLYDTGYHSPVVTAAGQTMVNIQPSKCSIYCGPANGAAPGSGYSRVPFLGGNILAGTIECQPVIDLKCRIL
jgi:hypothetical protein